VTPLPAKPTPTQVQGLSAWRVTSSMWATDF
jgi:hypothetical protein